MLHVLSVYVLHDMPEWNSIFGTPVLVYVTVNYRFSQGKRVAAVIDNFSNVMCRFVLKELVN